MVMKAQAARAAPPDAWLKRGLLLGGLVPLALTSTRNAQKQLGFKRWQQLHRLSYLVAVLAIVHFVWRVKRDLTQPLAYAAILALLLAARLPGWWKQRERARYRRHADA